MSFYPFSSVSTLIYFLVGVGVGSDSLPGADIEHVYVDTTEAGASDPQSQVAEGQGVVPLEVVEQHHDAVSLPSEVLLADFPEPGQEIEAGEELEPEIEVHHEPEQGPEVHKVHLRLVTVSQWFCDQTTGAQDNVPEVIQPTLTVQDPLHQSSAEPEVHKVPLRLVSVSQWFCDQTVGTQDNGLEVIQPTYIAQDPPHQSSLEPEVHKVSLRLVSVS